MKYFSSLIYTLSIISFSSFSCASEDASPSGTNDPASPSSINDPVNLKSQYLEGSIFGPEGPTKIIEVKNPITGNVWMDRNLGATEVAVSSSSSNSFGYLYQWGRRSDGHQFRNSTVSTALATNRNTPANTSFIIAPNFPFDWITPQISQSELLLKIRVWGGIDGINNPCPKGFRLPTEAEWQAEINSWVSKNATGALASPLKLPLGGFKNGNKASGAVDGGIREGGRYWTSYQSSLIFSNKPFMSSKIVEINPNNAFVYGGGNTNETAVAARGANAFGACVRCIKD